jgi:hypothetical protein
LVFATHEISLRGHSLRRIETAMQQMELSLLTALPGKQRSLVPEGQPVVLEIEVTRLKPPRSRIRASSRRLLREKVNVRPYRDPPSPIRTGLASSGKLKVLGNHSRWCSSRRRCCCVGSFPLFSCGSSVPWFLQILQARSCMLGSGLLQAPKLPLSSVGWRRGLGRGGAF